MNIEDLNIDRDDLVSLAECQRIISRAETTGKLDVFEISNLYVTVTAMAAKAGLDKEVLEELIKDIYSSQANEEQPDQVIKA